MPQTPAFVERFLATLGWATADLTAAGGVVGGADYCVRLDGSPVFFIGTSAAAGRSCLQAAALWMVGQDVGFGSLDSRRAHRARLPCAPFSARRSCRVAPVQVRCARVRSPRRRNSVDPRSRCDVARSRPRAIDAPSTRRRPSFPRGDRTPSRAPRERC